MSIQPTITPREYGILAGLAGKGLWDCPYPDYSVHLHDRKEWDEGHRRGSILLGYVEAQGAELLHASEDTD